jgi:hypothetical protein
LIGRLSVFMFVCLCFQSSVGVRVVLGLGLG